MTKLSKRMSGAAEQIDRDKLHSPEEAVTILKDMSKVKFDETVELHIKTNADTRHAEQMVRGVTLLPNGLGKPVRVLVFARAEGVEIAKGAGADFVGEDDLIRDIEGGWLDFDISLATPDVMPKISKLGPILGRKGLMPNPRSGTLVQARDLPRAIDEARRGRVEFRTDRTSIIHCPIGKISFEASQLVDNLTALIDAINQEKPDDIKGSFFKTAFLTSTMGPGVQLDVQQLLSLKTE
jgi:large subunit ribosomal protein L1